MKCPYHNIELVNFVGAIGKEECTHKNVFVCPIEGCHYLLSIYKSVKDFIEGNEYEFLENGEQF